LQLLGSQREASDTELLAIADTLISLGGQHAAVVAPTPLLVHTPLHHNDSCFACCSTSV